ncbi:hypothetical protein [Faucicola boevrei]|uniref:hypothetical protein n=1 Tax=Faucicola boevrei TaxID=346665 RepID=UPI000367907C|nr:hypothetical protein [Moraxella boevrei]
MNQPTIPPHDKANNLGITEDFRYKPTITMHSLMWVLVIMCLFGLLFVAVFSLFKNPQWLSQNIGVAQSLCGTHSPFLWCLRG